MKWENWEKKAFEFLFQMNCKGNSNIDDIFRRELIEISNFRFSSKIKFLNFFQFSQEPRANFWKGVCQNIKTEGVPNINDIFFQKSKDFNFMQTLHSGHNSQRGGANSVNKVLEISFKLWKVHFWVFFCTNFGSFFGQNVVFFKLPKFSLFWDIFFSKIEGFS